MKSREESFIEVLDELLPCYGVFGYTNRIVNGNFVEGHQKLLVIGKSFEIIYESDPAFTKRGEFPKSFKKFEIKHYELFSTSLRCFFIRLRVALSWIL